MALSGSSSAPTTLEGLEILCKYGVVASMRKEIKRSNNFGRKFRGYREYLEKDCGFFDWVDELMNNKCDMCMSLKTKVDENEEVLEKIQGKYHRVKQTNVELTSENTQFLFESRRMRSELYWERKLKMFALAALVISFVVYVVHRP